MLNIDSQFVPCIKALREWLKQTTGETITLCAARDALDIVRRDVHQMRLHATVAAFVTRHGERELLDRLSS